MRLSHRTIRPAGREISIRFDGKPIAALEGETIAAALSAAGIVAFRTTPGGSPRGLYCGMGACFDCVVTVDGRIGRRACMEKVADGMQVGSAASDVLAPLAPVPDGDDATEQACDLLVVGAGPAGLSAAIAAAEAGASVVVLDERDTPGGQFHKQLAPSHENLRPDAQFAEGAALAGRAVAAGVEMLTGATVWGAFGAGEVTAVVRGAAVTFRPRRLVIAAGAHERPMPLPGWTLPGVMTTGALQTLARAQRVAPAQRVLIAGNGPLNLQLACELLEGGVQVAAVVEAAPFPGLAAVAHAASMLRNDPGLAWQGLGYLGRLRRGGVKVLWGSRVTCIEGEGRAETVRIATPSGERSFGVEVVAMNLGFQPETGLARALDAAHRYEDAGLGHLATIADADGCTDVEGVFAVGDGASLGGSRVALARGRLAGLAVARGLGLAAPDEPGLRAGLARARRFQDALWKVFTPPPPEPVADDTIVCRCEEVTAGRLRAEIAGGLVSLPALKKATRAGMGRCQGRFCAASVARLCPQAPDAEAFAAPRVPVKPVPAAALMFEAPEFEAPLLVAPTPPHRRAPIKASAEADRACDILVIGGGAVGLSTAYYLAQIGRRRDAGGPRRGRPRRQHRQCRQPARAADPLRLRRPRHPGGWRSGRAYPAAGAAQRRAVEGDRRRGGREPRHLDPRRAGAGGGREHAGVPARQGRAGAALRHRDASDRRQRAARPGAASVADHGRRGVLPGGGADRSAAWDHGAAAVWRRRTARGC